MKRAIGVLLIIAVVAGGLATARSVALSKADDALAGRGLIWQSTERGLLSAQWMGLSAPGLTAERLSLTLLPGPAAVLTGVQVDLDAIERSESGASSGGRSIPLALAAEGVTVRWKEEVLAEGLSGTLLPTISLVGPGARLSRTEAGWSGELTRMIGSPDDPLSGLVTLTVEGSDPVELRLSMPEVSLTHPTLATRALPPTAITATAQWSDGKINGNAQIGGVSLTIEGPLSPDTADLAFRAEAVPLSEILALFGDRLIPERKRAEVRGTLTLTGRITGPPVAWRATLETDGLAVEGVLLDPASMRWGNFSWRAPGPDGGFVIRRTGDEHATWTDIEQARMAGDAVIAAEDARFKDHGGFDVEGINVALGELSAGEERPRGGSTITQQLAKNLFLDGERTIARKLRELLYALEMERTVGKLRILELYLNVVEYGPGIYGIRQASDHYFLKRPENLAPHEAAFLAAILPSPRSWHARVLAGRRPPEQTIDRILNNMINTGALSANTARWAMAEQLIFVPPER